MEEYGKKESFAWKFWKGNKVITLLAIIGVVYFFLQYLSPLLSPILIAMLFVTMSGPLLKRMQEKLHIHRQIGVVVLLLFASAIVALLVWILFSWAIGSLPKWIGRLDELRQDVGVMVYNGSQIASHALGIDGEYLSETLLQYVEKVFYFLQDRAVPGMLEQSIVYVKGIAAFGGFLIVFIIATILLAKDYDRIMNQLLDREEFHVLLEVICGVIRYIATYLRAQLLIMTIIAATCSLTLALIGIEHGALWGLVAGLLDALPFIGTGVVLIPLAITRVIYGKIWQTIICVVLYACCAFFREMIEPRLIGSRMGVSPIALLISVYAGIQLFGIWGIIKGPLGFIIIYQTYLSLSKRMGNTQL